MMLAGVPVSADATAELTEIVRTAGEDELADRLERALDDEVKLLGLTVDERACALILNALDDPPKDLAELRAVLLGDISGARRRDSTLQTSRSDPILTERPLACHGQP